MPSFESDRSVDLLGVDVIGFDADLAHIAATLRPKTKKLGLSPGLLRRNTVVTAEKAWGKLRIGVKIELIC